MTVAKGALSGETLNTTDKHMDSRDKEERGKPVFIASSCQCRKRRYGLVVWFSVAPNQMRKPP
jgi:hypothetical protein